MRNRRRPIADDAKPNGTLLKVSAFLTRRPDLSHDEFHRYWIEVHTPMLSTPMPGAPTVYRYVQLHTIPEIVPALQTAAYDGVAEIWFESLADAAAMFTSSRYNTVVAADEEKFLDRSKTAFLYTHENVIFRCGPLEKEPPR